MVRDPPTNAGNLGLTPGWGRSPGGRTGDPLQCSCLETPSDRGAWRAAVLGVAVRQEGAHAGWLAGWLPTPDSEGVMFLSNRELRIGIFHHVGQGPAVTHCREGGRGHRFTWSASPKKHQVLPHLIREKRQGHQVVSAGPEVSRGERMSCYSKPPPDGRPQSTSCSKASWLSWHENTPIF